MRPEWQGLRRGLNCGHCFDQDGSSLNPGLSKRFSDDKAKVRAGDDDRLVKPDPESRLRASGCSVAVWVGRCGHPLR